MQYADVFTNKDIHQINVHKVWLGLIFKGYNSNGSVVLAIE
jgi:hypothetical protein